MRKCLLIFIVILLKFLVSGNELINPDLLKLRRMAEQFHQYKIESYFQKRQSWATSPIGSILFKKTVHPRYYRQNKTFTILHWTYWEDLRLRYYGNHFVNCSVKNCRVTSNDDYITKADAIVVHVQYGMVPFSSVKRPSHQRWIFMSDESPVNVFSMSDPRPRLSEFANLFNWTMTYRTDSDIPIPYGRTLPRPVPLTLHKISEPITNLIPYWHSKRTDVFVAVLISDCCNRRRLEFIENLQKFIDIDIYGKCSPNDTRKDVCPGHMQADCPVINEYLFYLAFENSNCRQYISEKTFYNSYIKGSIPIIMGAPKEDCEKLLPPHSFLHVSDYPHPMDLAADVQRIIKSKHKLLMYHQWRRFFEVVNEHGYFQSESSHMCRVCEALNIDLKPKVYSEDDLKLFFEPQLLCESPYVLYRTVCDV